MTTQKTEYYEEQVKELQQENIRLREIVRKLQEDRLKHKRQLFEIAKELELPLC